MVQRTGDAGSGKVLFVQNNFYYDAFFLKAIGAPFLVLIFLLALVSADLSAVTVLNGACDNGWCTMPNSSARYHVSALCVQFNVG
jgi:integrin alpha FG-GAP repeat containing protein 1